MIPQSYPGSLTIHGIKESEQLHRLLERQAAEKGGFYYRFPNGGTYTILTRGTGVYSFVQLTFIVDDALFDSGTATLTVPFSVVELLEPGIVSFRKNAPRIQGEGMRFLQRFCAGHDWKIFVTDEL